MQWMLIGRILFVTGREPVVESKAWASGAVCKTSGLPYDQCVNLLSILRTPVLWSLNARMHPGRTHLVLHILLRFGMCLLERCILFPLDVLHLVLRLVTGCLGDSCGVKSVALPFTGDHESKYQKHLNRFRAPPVLINWHSHSYSSFCYP